MLVLDDRGRVWQIEGSLSGSVNEVSFPKGFLVSAPIPEVVQLSAGPLYNLALDRSGQVWSWRRHYPYKSYGLPYYPVLEQGFSTPTAWNDLPKLSSIGQCETTGFGITQNGQLWTWDTLNEPMTNGVITEASNPHGFPQVNPFISGVKAAGIDARNLVLLLEDGRVFDWSTTSQVGRSRQRHGRLDTNQPPVEVSGLPPGTCFVHSYHERRLAVGNQGLVWCWGSFLPGEEGAPFYPRSFNQVKRLVGGESFIAGLRSDGQIAYYDMFSDYLLPPLEEGVESLIFSGICNYPMPPAKTSQFLRNMSRRQLFL